MTISSLNYVMDHNRAAVLRLLRYCYLTVGGAKRPRLSQLKRFFKYDGLRTQELEAPRVSLSFHARRFGNLDRGVSGDEAAAQPRLA